MKRMDGRVTVITGGASGIGRAGAELMAREGGRVVIGDLNEADAVATAEHIVAQGGKALGMSVNVMDEDSLKALIDGAVAEFGRLDVMCNHVGGSNPRKDTDVVSMELEEFDRTMELNVRSTMLGCRLAIPHMKTAGGGSIINTASVGGLSGDFIQVAYGTAKAAVIRMTQYIATAHGGDRIRCNAIAPGAVMTPSLIDNLPTEMVDGIRSHNSLPFIGEPDDIANVMLFLASEESRYITGQCIVADGGMTSHSSIAEIRRPDEG